MKPINSDQQYFSYCNQLEKLMKKGLTTKKAQNKYHKLVTHIHNWDDKQQELIMLNLNSPTEGYSRDEIIETIKKLRDQ